MRGITAALAFVLFITLARSWESERIGEFALLLNFYIFLSIMPLLGLSLLVLRDLSQHPEYEPRYRSSLSVITLGTAALLAIALSLVGYFFYPPTLLLPICIIGFSIVLGAPAVAEESIYMAREKMWIPSSIAAGEAIIRTACALFCIYCDYGLVWIALCFAAGRLFASLAYAFLPHPQKGPVDFTLIKNLISQSPTFLLIVFASAALLRVDTIYLSLSQNLSVVGNYNTAFRLLDLLISIIVMATVAVFPVIARNFTQSPSTKEAFTQAFKRILMAGFPTTLILIASSPVLFNVLYAGKFKESIPIFSILVIMLFFYTIDRIFSTIVHAAKKPELDRNALLCGAALLCVLLILLVPPFGATGAAISSAGAQFGILIIRLFQSRVYFGWQGFLWNSRNIFLAALIMVAVNFIMNHFTHNWINLPITLLIYVVFLVSMREISVKGTFLMLKKLQLPQRNSERIDTR